MTEAEARQRLERMVAAAEQPVLTSAEVDDLLALAARPDSTGVLSGTVGWAPTWDLGSAAAEGLRWKAAKAMHEYDFAADGQSFSRSQKHAMLLRTAGVYAGRAASGSVRIRTPNSVGIEL